ncbi:unnamed protein product [Gongylonema pulchrum]|uniref:Maestro heat-like repeat-containing protein family member 1 n=1 Tax=Gongylonema pulchrum TaxID=637853 RepID=A0A183DUY0_9BILA|nr:unnamed protein product [Gongylonema pulchrum]
MIVSLTKTRLTSVTQHGRNIRCILVCARILLQDGSNEETRRLVSAVLRYLIERDTSDKVVPVLCYAVTIVPELADELLFEQNEQYEVLRRIVAVHLASRDELCAIFNKVIMSRLKKTTSISSLTCLTKLDDAIYRGWFEEAVNGAVNTSGLDLHSLEVLIFATHRLVPSKEALVYPLLAECFGTISSHFSPKEKGEKSTENRLLHFGLNDWLRVLKPLTKYVHLR